ncbi:hypothetical protein CYMTET_46295 [Cymbomonas tetramitiformis]|uniref:dTMP kinase n=1 Tax=Cymbomonas tetramitiformis TaxID=36881 RepID=A0AAE0BY87_9CHLO|nr:hypothetical protein CYMTET_46295 [Cymbomonas tetramitiformis]
MINEYLTDTSVELNDAAVHLLFSANRWEKSALMEDKLKQGVTLVVDRYSYSGVSFTAAKQIPGLDLAWLKAPEKGLLRPDAVFYLQIPVETASQRGGYGEERYEKVDLQQKVASNFIALQDDTWQMIDATRSIAEVQEEVQMHAKEVIKKCEGGAAFTHLW